MYHDHDNDKPMKEVGEQQKKHTKLEKKNKKQDYISANKMLDWHIMKQE